jgi:replicative DNA helicase
MTTNLENVNNELGRISRTIKLNAQRNNIAWLAASQLNRKVEYRENKRPLLSDLRDSGNLEQDSDIVIMLYRDEMYNQTTVDNSDMAELLVRKNRHGPTASLLARFEKEIMKFSATESF